MDDFETDNMQVVVVILQRAHDFQCKVKGIDKYNKCDFKTSQPFSEKKCEAKST